MGRKCVGSHSLWLATVASAFAFTAVNSGAWDLIGLIILFYEHFRCTSQISKIEKIIFHLTEIFKEEDKKWDPWSAVSTENFVTTCISSKYVYVSKQMKQETKEINIKMARQNSQNILVLIVIILWSQSVLSIEKSYYSSKEKSEML